MSSRPLISVVLPAYNEAEGLRHAIGVIETVVASCGENYELIVIDDGSCDDTYRVIVDLSARNPCIRGLRFSRNFGKEAALLAGLERAGGDVVITMDVDLQHPPELIPTMIARWREGYRVVNAVKRDRAVDGVVARIRAKLFNRVLSVAAGIDLEHSSDFKLLDRGAVDVLVAAMPERRRFYRGLSSWLGFSQADVPFSVAARASGGGKWSLIALIELATTALVSFTSAPLRIVTILGFLTLAFGSVVAIDAVWSWLHGDAVSGFATIIITLLFVSSSIMISLGIIGEYIAKIYDELKGRPVYLLQDACGFGANERPVSATRRLGCVMSIRADSECPQAVSREVPQRDDCGNDGLRDKERQGD